MQIDLAVKVEANPLAQARAINSFNPGRAAFAVNRIGGIVGGVPVCDSEDVISVLPSVMELLAEPPLTVGLVPCLAVGLLEGFVFAELSPLVCLKTK